MSPYTPTDLDLFTAQQRLAEHVERYRDGGEARSVAADTFTLVAVRSELECGSNGPDTRIRQALARLAALEDWHDRLEDRYDGAAIAEAAERNQRRGVTCMCTERIPCVAHDSR